MFGKVSCHPGNGRPVEWTWLLSALRFHGLTTQASSEVWPAVGPKDWVSRPDGISVRIESKASVRLPVAADEAHAGVVVGVDYEGIAEEGLPTKDPHQQPAA